MAAAKYDFDVEQGSSYNLTFIYKNNAGTPIDITNWCARMLITTSDNQTITYTSGNSNSNYRMSIDGINGKITLMLPALTTNNFTFKTAKYDFELESNDIFYTNGGQYTTRVLFGLITIIKRNSKNSTQMEC
jgi:hypothetical protein